MLILIALLSVLLAGCVGYVIFLVHWITADCRTDSSWFFAKWFAAIGFVAGGSIVFYVGLRAFNPPPPPPGTHLCGNAVLGGMVVMVIGTPLGATAFSLGALLIGRILDRIR